MSSSDSRPNWRRAPQPGEGPALDGSSEVRWWTARIPAFLGVGAVAAAAVLLGAGVIPVGRLFHGANHSMIAAALPRPMASHSSGAAPTTGTAIPPIAAGRGQAPPVLRAPGGNPVPQAPAGNPVLQGPAGNPQGAGSRPGSRAQAPGSTSGPLPEPPVTTPTRLPTRVPTSITVDNSGSGFHWFGPTGANFQQSQQSPSADGGQFYTTMNYLPCIGYDQHNAATWTAQLPAASTWTISVLVPTFHDLGFGVPYHISTPRGGSDVTVDQQDHQGQWVSLGRFRLPAGPSSVTMHDSDTVSNCSTDGFRKYLAVDAVRWTPSA